MNGEVCLTPSKWGQCTFLAGHTGPHRSPSGHDWKDEAVVIDVEERLKLNPVMQEVLYGTVYQEIVHPVKRGPGRPRKWFKDENGKWYKKE